MKPNISSSNVADDRLVRLQSNSAFKAPEMSSLNHSQQLRPIRMEQVRPQSTSSNMYQQNYQSLHQNNNPQYQQLQQNMYQTQQQQQQNYQREQQYFRISSNQNPTTPLHHDNNYNVSQLNNFRNIPRDPIISSENEGIQMAPQMKSLNLQQPIRPQFISPNYSNIIHQTKAQIPKLLNDRIDSNFPNVSQADCNRSQVLQDHSVNPEKKPFNLDLNPNRTFNATEIPNEASNTPQTRTDPENSNFTTETLLESLNEPSPAPYKNCKFEADELINLPKQNKQIDSDSGVDKKIKDSALSKKEKNQHEQNNNIKYENIAAGMVQKNIKFFEENDITKKPLKPEILGLKNVKSSKASLETIKRVTYKKEDESGVDETPVIHPNLRSIFQAPRKVAKIPHVKTSKVLKKLKSKKLFHKPSSRKPTISEYLRPYQCGCMQYKIGNGSKQKTQVYGSKEELLAFFENTKSWRKLNSHESKSNGNVKKDKLVHKATTNGDIPTPKQTPSKPKTSSKRNLSVSPTKTPNSPGTPAVKSLPKTPESPAPSTPLIKKVPMNKIQVGAAPSPNLKTVRSKVGSLANTTHKPGGGNVKIESHKIDLSNVQPRTEAKNEQYKRTGGDKKIQQVKLQWSAKSKIGSLENATYKPGGGDKKIESVKLDFKEKAKPKVGSKDNVKYTPGGGNVKIENQKLEFKAQSKVGSLDNVKHKPGGGEIKIFDDKTYLRQVSGNSSEGRASGTQSPLHTSVSKSFSETSQDGS